ncbi:MAG TPA: hypothetical protein VMB03_10055 [Bryobacteraceae bacterium]|nr:hypothetical protein [Bryobacteraceae bacterium]
MLIRNCPKTRYQPFANLPRSTTVLRAAGELMYAPGAGAKPVNVPVEVLRATSDPPKDYL